MKLVSLAPRYIGDFEKGVDYKGDVAALERSLRDHAAIAEMLGPYKLSLHSGSDKLSMYPALARATKGRFHVKTAGTSYLEALRVVARHDAALFRRIVDFARGRYDTDKATYHVSATLALGPAGRRRSPTRPSWSGSTWRTGPTSRAGRGFTSPGRQILHCTFGSVLTDPELGPAVRRRPGGDTRTPTPRSWPTTSAATWTPSGRGCESRAIAFRCESGGDDRPLREERATMSESYLEELFGLDGQVAVVIGGTGVLGGALAEGLARAGATVVVAGRDAEKGAARVRAIEAAGGKAAFAPVDVMRRESIEELLRAGRSTRTAGSTCSSTARGSTTPSPYFDAQGRGLGPRPRQQPQGRPLGLPGLRPAHGRGRGRVDPEHRQRDVAHCRSRGSSPTRPRRRPWST